VCCWQVSFEKKQGLFDSFNFLGFNFLTSLVSGLRRHLCWIGMDAMTKTEAGGEVIVEIKSKVYSVLPDEDKDEN